MSNIHDVKNFIRPIKPDEKTIIIQNKKGLVSYKINVFSVISMFLKPNGNVIFIKMDASNYQPEIDFSSHSEALTALSLLQQNIKSLKDGNFNIPQEVQDYVDMVTKFVFHQATPEDTWLVSNHEMNKFPSVTIVNDDLEVIEGYIKYIDTDNIEIKFNSNLTGWVYLT